MAACVAVPKIKNYRNRRLFSTHRVILRYAMCLLSEPWVSLVLFNSDYNHTCNSQTLMSQMLSITERFMVVLLMWFSMLLILVSVYVLVSPSMCLDDIKRFR